MPGSQPFQKSERIGGNKVARRFRLPISGVASENLGVQISLSWVSEVYLFKKQE